MAGADFVVVETEFVLSRFETFRYPPSGSFHTDLSVDRLAVRAPSSEIGVLTIGDPASDQRTARPQDRSGSVELFGVKIGIPATAPQRSLLPPWAWIAHNLDAHPS